MFLSALKRGKVGRQKVGLVARLDVRGEAGCRRGEACWQYTVRLAVKLAANLTVAGGGEAKQGGESECETAGQAKG